MSSTLGTMPIPMVIAVGERKSVDVGGSAKSKRECLARDKHLFLFFIERV